MLSTVLSSTTSDHRTHITMLLWTAKNWDIYWSYSIIQKTFAKRKEKSILKEIKKLNNLHLEKHLCQLDICRSKHCSSQDTPKPTPIQQSNETAPWTLTMANCVLFSVVILTIHRINLSEPALLFPQSHLLYFQNSVPSCKELQFPHSSLQLTPTSAHTLNLTAFIQPWV